jgi:hypothetical protein
MSRFLANLAHRSSHRPSVRPRLPGPYEPVSDAGPSAELPEREETVVEPAWLPARAAGPPPLDQAGSTPVVRRPPPGGLSGPAASDGAAAAIGRVVTGGAEASAGFPVPAPAGSSGPASDGSDPDLPVPAPGGSVQAASVAAAPVSPGRVAAAQHERVTAVTTGTPPAPAPPAPGIPAPRVPVPAVPVLEGPAPGVPVPGVPVPARLIPARPAPGLSADADGTPAPPAPGMPVPAGAVPAGADPAPGEPPPWGSAAMVVPRGPVQAAARPADGRPVTPHVPGPTGTVPSRRSYLDGPTAAPGPARPAGASASGDRLETLSAAAPPWSDDRDTLLIDPVRDRDRREEPNRPLGPVNLGQPLTSHPVRRGLPAAPIDPGPVGPTIQVTIGRVEVRAAAPNGRPNRPRSQPEPVSLDEYLLRRSGGGGSP